MSLLLLQEFLQFIQSWVRPGRPRPFPGDGNWDESDTEMGTVTQLGVGEFCDFSRENRAGVGTWDELREREELSHHPGDTRSHPSLPKSIPEILGAAPGRRGGCGNAMVVFPGGTSED